MNIREDIERLLDRGEAPEQQWVDGAMRRYPYFALPLLLHVKHNDDQQALHRLSIMSPDRRDLSIVVGNAPAAFASFYPTEHDEKPLDVDNVIDKFLETYAQGSNTKEIDALSKAIFNPTPDYADILAAQHDDAPTLDKEDELISSFIEHSRRQERDAIAQSPKMEHHINQEDVAQVAHDAVENSTQNDDSMLSESLAKVYIARGKYSKALEIIESINLNFPEKSIYFADQIRFLRKLVLNETLKNKL
jgi:tetratricopeptide (TPR) repeat protein